MVLWGFPHTDHPDWASTSSTQEHPWGPRGGGCTPGVAEGASLGRGSYRWSGPRVPLRCWRTGRGTGRGTPSPGPHTGPGNGRSPCSSASSGGGPPSRRWTSSSGPARSGPVDSGSRRLWAARWPGPHPWWTPVSSGGTGRATLCALAPLLSLSLSLRCSSVASLLTQQPSVLLSDQKYRETAQLNSPRLAEVSRSHPGRSFAPEINFYSMLGKAHGAIFVAQGCWLH